MTDANTCIGTLRLNLQGKGFVEPGEPFEAVIVNPDDQGNAIDGDRVEVETWPGLRRPEGRIVRVLERGRTRLTGVLRRGRDGALLLEPDDPRLQLPLVIEESGPASYPAGEVVLADILGYPERRGSPLRVRLVRRLGEAGRLRTEVARVLAGAGVEEHFPAAVLAEAAGVPREVGAAECVGRRDLRAVPFVTIDPRLARDFDDAVAIEELASGACRVYVAVADVSAYVAEGSALDGEARRRGCSVYLPDRAIPMLPPSLSAAICSLVPHEDRLAMVVELEVSAEGEVTAASCAPSVIHSRGQLDYAGVAGALQGDLRGRRAAYREHTSQLASLQRVAAALRQRRLARGSLDLDLPQAEVVLDEDDPDRVRDIRESQPDEPIKRAYGLIEELMVAANEAVGRLFAEAGQDTIWRVHPLPGLSALERLAILMGSYGIGVDPEELAGRRGLARLLVRLKGHRAARPLCYQVLRTLKQASYGTVNLGHHGLASATYLHFTSPIRRYPDLIVHRLLKAGLGPGRGRRGAPTLERRELQAIATEASGRERSATEVEREVQSLYAARLLQDRIGDELWGTVVGLTSFGLFAALERPFVEGLIRIDRLEDWYELDPARLRLFGRGSGRVFSLGDRVRVRVSGTSVARRQVDLDLILEKGGHQADQAAPDAPSRGGQRPGGRRPPSRNSGERRRGGGRGAGSGPRGGGRGGAPRRKKRR